MAFTKRNKQILYLIFTVVIAFIILYIYRKTFKNTKAKTVCLVWRNSIDKSHYHGLGDKIRGAIALNQFCRKNDYNFMIDATDDICGKFLKNVLSNKYNTIKKIDVITKCSYNYGKPECESVIGNYDFSNNNTIYVYTNASPENVHWKVYSKDSISKEDKEYGRFLCTPNDTFKSEIDEVISSLPADYGVQHFRFDDKVFYGGDLSINDPIFVTYYNILVNKYTPNDVLLSNSNNFKQFAHRVLGIHIIKCDGSDCNIDHIGTSDSYEKVKPTFIEFYVIAKAKYIKTISSYDWVSNFVKWPALIYDVPLEEHIVKK